LRISLPSASYIPQFHRVRNGDNSGLPKIDALVTTPLDQVAPPVWHVRPHRLLALALVVVAAVMVALPTRRTSNVVLSTQIIDGEPGSPKIEATYFW
jgi:hypothetical protein